MDKVVAFKFMVKIKSQKIIIILKSRVGKKHVFGSRRMFAGMGCQTLACALAITVLHRILTPDGPAIKRAER